MRHDNVRDLFTCLLDRVCNNVQAEPHLTPLTGEIFDHRTANTSREARLDIRARSFWRRGQDAFFDIRITHVNAASHRHLGTETIFLRQEQEKKRAYNQRVMDVEQGTFTPLVIGTNGGMGQECHKFMTNLADQLARKQNEKYSQVIGWLRTKLSFEVLRASLLCVRGSRRPWINQEATKVSTDFGLRFVEAGLVE